MRALHADLGGASARSRLVRAAASTGALKIGSGVIAFLASLLYARVLGPHGYGLYAYVIACTAILAVPASLGLPKYLLREATHQPATLRALLRWADRRVLLSGAASGVLLAMGALVPSAAAGRPLFWVAAPLPLLMNLGAVRESLLQAYGWIARSQWPRLLLAPALTLGVMVLTWHWRGTLRPAQIVAMTVLAATLPVLVNTLQLRRAWAGAPGQASEATPSLRAALPFMWLGGLYLLVSRTDILMLGAIRGAAEAGIYAVAARAAEVLLFVGMAANTAVSPSFVRLHRQGEHEQLQRLMTAMGRRVLLLTAPMALGVIVFAGPLLTWLYGQAYAEGVLVLRILGATQLLVVAGGSIGTLLNMTGHEHDHLRTIGWTLLLNVVLNAALIPRFGATGAAAATCTSVVVSRIALQWLVRRRLGIRTSALGF